MSRRRSAGTAVGSAVFKARCLELIDRVRETRTEIVVTRHGRPVARLVPYDAPDRVSLIGALPGSVVRYDAPFDPVPGTWLSGDADDGR